MTTSPIRMLIACLVMLAVWTQPAMTFPRKVLTVQPAKEGATKNSPLRLELREAADGLQLSINFAETPEMGDKILPAEQAGGDYMLYLDDAMLEGAPYKGFKLNVVREVSITALHSGKHSLRCELRAPSGKAHTGEIDFIFDGAPAVSLGELAVNKSGELDGEVTVDFLGAAEGLSGFVDLLLDERPVATTKIKKEQASQKTTLAHLVGKAIATTHLATGTHLLTLKATAVNGNATTLRGSLVVQTTPELEIKQDKHGAFQEARAVFLKAPEGFSGSVEIFYDQGLVLSKRSEAATIPVTRDEIVQGLRKNKVKLDGPVEVVVSLRAMNNTERWQVLKVQP